MGFSLCPRHRARTGQGPQKEPFWPQIPRFGPIVYGIEVPDDPNWVSASSITSIHQHFADWGVNLNILVIYDRQYGPKRALWPHQVPDHHRPTPSQAGWSCREQTAVHLNLELREYHTHIVEEINVQIPLKPSMWRLLRQYPRGVAGQQTLLFDFSRTPFVSPEVWVGNNRAEKPSSHQGDSLLPHIWLFRRLFDFFLFLQFTVMCWDIN